MAILYTNFHVEYLGSSSTVDTVLLNQDGSIVGASRQHTESWRGYYDGFRFMVSVSVGVSEAFYLMTMSMYLVSVV